MKHGDQTQIAAKASISPSMLNQILNGKKKPSWKTAKRLALETGTDPVLWLDGTPDEIKAVLSAEHRQACKHDCVSTNVCACEA